MTHLRIEQNSNIEIVNSILIQKLYDISLSIPEPVQGQEDDAQVSGNIQSNYAYKTDVNYLTTRFPNLQINITQGYYIPFEDSTLGNFAIQQYGDGIGCTAAMAAGVTSRNTFWGTQMSSSQKSQVTSLNDFQYFPGINNSIDDNSTLISGFSNATSIKFPDTTFSYNYRWDRTIVDGSFQDVDYGNAVFNGPTEYTGILNVIICNNSASQWKDSYLPKQNAYHRVKLFVAWYRIPKIIFPEGKTEMWENYISCSNLQYVEYPSTTNIMGDGTDFCNGGRNIECVVVKAVTPPSWTGWDSTSSSSTWGVTGLGYFKVPQAIYVPDNSVTAYTSVVSGGTTNESVWANPSVKAVIKPMSTMPQVYRGMGTVTQEDIDRV